MNTPRLLPPLLLALAATAPLRAQAHRATAFTNARLITVSGDVIDRGTLVIRNGEIEAVGADVAPPAGARIIDATGKTILPGLVCATSKAGLNPSSRTTSPVPPRGRRRFPFPMRTQAARPQNRAATRVVDALYARQKVFGELLDAGITTLVITPQGSAFPGLGAILAPNGKTLRELTADGEAFVQITMARNAQTKKLLKDNFAKAKKIVEERHKPKEPVKPKEAAAPKAKPEQAEAKPGPNKGAKTEGKPGAKPQEPSGKKAPAPKKPAQKPAPKKDPNLELLADLLEGKRRALLTIGSAADLLHWKDAVGDDLKFPFTLVVDRHDPFSGTIDMVLDEVVALGRPVLLPPSLTVKARTQHLIHPAKLLHEAGVEVGFLTGDSPAAVRLLFFRLMEMVRAGLPADVALKGVTLVPAKALGVDATVGSLEVGKKADLLVFDGDPLSPEGELDAVWFRGQRVPQQP